jgi:hypothetical protein
MIALVACSKSKLRAAAPASELYTSALFRLSLAYAQRTCAFVYIVSAKYGLVHPAQVIEPYDLTIVTLPARDRVLWGARVATQLHTSKGLRLAQGKALVIFAGAAYAEPIVEAYRQAYQANVNVVQPLDGLQIGERLSWLRSRDAMAGAGVGAAR